MLFHFHSITKQCNYDFNFAFIDSLISLNSAEPDYSRFDGSPLSAFSSIDVADVQKLIAKSPNKSCCLDPVPTWLVKEFADELAAPFITAIYNKSFSDGYFPRSFRIAVITPILKKQTLDPTNISNYRPISNLSFLSKLLERAAKIQLLAHLEKNDLLPEHQSAYRACHSTESALLKITSDALMAADRGQVTLIGMLDLSSASDCVDHRIFTRRLERSFGVTGLALLWTTSYLDGRMQRVHYNGLDSELTVIECGVPQGSVLGPAYFLLYSSDVFEIARQHGFQIHGYADDLQLYQHCEPSDTNVLNSRFVDCLEAIQEWMSQNRLRLNASKTEVLWLGSSKRLKNLLLPTVVVSGCAIPLSTSVRTLGVVIDSGLTFSEHVSKLVNTCYYHLRQIRSIRKSLTIDSAHALVRALVLSRLDYCNSLLAGITRALIGRLDSVMRAAARLILQLHYTDHVTSLIRGRLHWLDAASRINYKLCVLAYKCQRNLAPNYLAEYCIPVNSVSGRSRLRSATTGELIIPPCSTKRLGPRAFAVSCPSAWNSLPPEFRGQDTGLLTFKRELKTVLFRRMQ